MIRVLQVGLTSNLGGIEMLIMNIYRNIDRNKIQFDFLDEGNGIYYSEEIEKLGGKIIKIPSRRENYPKYHAILKKLMKSGRYEFVHCNCLAVANIDIAKMAYKYKKTRVIIHSHQDMKLRNIKSEILHRYNRKWLENKQIIRLACSEQAARWIHGNRLTDEGKVKIVKNSIESNKFKYDENIRVEYKKRLKLENKFIIGCVGRFAYQKNYEFLAKIFREVLKINENAVLVCVGDEGGMKQAVLEKFEADNIMKSVRLLGIRQDVECLMQVFDAFVLPSRWEGLGIVYIEAQAAGLQTFASNVVPKETAVTELIHYISLQESPKAWAEMIMKYASNYRRKDTVEEINKQGYNIETIVDTIEKVYLEKE